MCRPMNIIHHYGKSLKQQIRMFVNSLTHQIFPDAHYTLGTVMGDLAVAGMIRHISESSRNLQLMEIQIIRKGLTVGRKYKRLPRKLLRAKK